MDEKALLRRMNELKDKNEAATLTAAEEEAWRRLCAYGYGAEFWSWRIQDRDWKNNDDPLRFSTRAGDEWLRS